MQELINVFQGIGSHLGLASTGIAFGYIALILASLLCVFYGLVLWVREQLAAAVQRWQKIRPLRRGRSLRWRRWR